MKGESNHSSTDMQAPVSDPEDGDLQDGPIQKDYQSDLGITHTKTVTLPGITTRSGFVFESIDINFMTIGQLSPQKDNAILICHAFSGDARVAGIDPESGKPGWWDHHVGPGKSIDTLRFFVICSNVIGGCNGSTGPSSINPKTGQPYAMTFPPISIWDMVDAQVRLIDFLGIKKLFSVIGGSMGGMQALVWAVRYPDRVHTAIPIATCMAHSSMQIAFNEVGRQSIITDPNWQNGNYYNGKRPEHGLAVARMVGHITYLSESYMRTRFGRRLQRPARPEDLFPTYFQIESYLHHQGSSFVRRFDPNSYLYITKALDMFDLLDSAPADKLLADVTAHFLVISFESDWLYTPLQSQELVKSLNRMNIQVTYTNLETQKGHDSFLVENEKLRTILHHFLYMEYRNFLKAS